MKKKKISSSAKSIQNFLNMNKQDMVNTKHFEYEFLNSEHIKKINEKYLGILSKSLTVNYCILNMIMDHNLSRKYTGVIETTHSSMHYLLLLKFTPRRNMNI